MNSNEKNALLILVMVLPTIIWLILYLKNINK